MPNNIQRRTMGDLAAAVTAYFCMGSWLASLSSAGTVTGVLAVGAGAAMLSGTCASILRRKRPVYTPADRITLLRAVLVACCATLAVIQVLVPKTPDVLLLVLGALALALDAVDGPVARRTRSVSAEGARLDTETDAALTLVLSIAAAANLGAWTLLIGLMYYTFSVAGRFRPSLRKTLQVSTARKAIGGFQPLALLLALLPGIPVWPKTAAVLFALALLSFSFGRDLIILKAMRRAERVTGGTAGVLGG